MLSNTATIGWLSAAHWGGYTIPSPNFFLLERSQIVFNYVSTGVKMIYASPKPFLLLRNFLKISLSRRSAFRLQSLSKRIIPFGYSSDMPVIKKLINFTIGSGDYSKFAESQVNADTKINRFYPWQILLDGNVEEKFFMLFVILEVSRGSFPVQILLKVFRDVNLKSLSSTNSSKRNFFSI